VKELQKINGSAKLLLIWDGARNVESRNKTLHLKT
jgi:hypothetical protein